MIAKKQNEIEDLPKLESVRYENIFRVYQDSTNNKEFYYYNITNKISLPARIDSSVLASTVIDRKLPWTTLSYVIYGTIYLWYLLFMLNKTSNKFFVSPGDTITYIKPEFVNTIINKINE